MLGRRHLRPVIQLRRHPVAGLTLLLSLLPFLAAGPVMPCAGFDAEHHEAAGHAVETAHGAMTHAAMTHVVLEAGGGISPIPDDAERNPPSPADCSMGMTCSGTILAPSSTDLAEASVFRAVPASAGLWELHTSDPSVRARPPKA